MSAGPTRFGRWSGAIGAGVCIAALSPIAGAEPVRKSDLVEKTSRRLVSVDVTIVGPREIAASLRADDFELTVAGRAITAFDADPACPAPSASPEAPPIVARPPTFLLYFDEAHLTAEGRSRSIGLAREVIPGLLSEGGSAILVSGSFQIKHFAGPTQDVAQLLDGLDRLEQDAAQVDGMTTRVEERRAEEVLSELERLDVNTGAAVNTLPGFQDPKIQFGGHGEQQLLQKREKEVLLRRVRTYQDEETSVARRGLERLALALDRLTPAAQPRIAFYFGDTLRQNPGDHYFGVLRETSAGKRVYSDDGDDRFATKSARNPFGVERELNQFMALAATRGVRLYTVQAQGLTTSSQRVRDAQSTLVSLARETGGSAFLNGASAETIVGRIATDTACTYLLSFDGGNLPEDKPLPVEVFVKRDGLKVNARGIIAVQSRDARLRHERLSALYGVGSRRSDLPLRSALIALGYEKGKFSALAQVAAREVPVADGEWEVGFTLVRDGAIEEELTERMHAAAGGGALAMERTIEFEPGEYALVGIAQEMSTELTSSDVRVGSWPDPRQRSAVLTPIAILQPAAGTFLRKKEVRSSGNLALADDEPLRIGAPTALVAVACRSPKEERTLRVERRIEGDVAVEGFPPILLEPSKDPCVQIRDLIPPATLGEGFFRYEVVVRREDEVLARVDRVFRCQN